MRSLQIIIIFLLSSVLLYATESESYKKITPEQYIETYKYIAIIKMKEYGIPASITLAQGMLESGNGNSILARHAKNHFGIKCHLEWSGATFYQDDDEKNECFRKYSEVEESYKDHSLFLTTRDRYKDLFKLQVTDYKGWAHGLKKAGYATNPKYPQLLINLIERYGLDKYDDSSYKPEIAKQKKEEPETIITHHKPEIKTINKKPDNKSSYDPDNASIDLKYRVVEVKNNIKYIIAQENDNIDKICKDLDMFKWQIQKYNDLKNTQSIESGQIIYLQPKRNKGDAEFHIVKKDETLWEISQQYGIKIKHLVKKNNLSEDYLPKEGEKLLLRKHKH
jgi:hypothetical protein